jgi:hypothetical protein
MTKKYTDQVITITTYVAEDGTEFGTEWECNRYERDIELHKKWGERRVNIVREDGSSYGNNFFYIISHEELVSLIDYLVLTENIKVSGEEYSDILANVNNYIDTWVTYNYSETAGFYLFTLDEKTEHIKDNINELQEILKFYDILRYYQAELYGSTATKEGEETNDEGI